MSEETIAKEVEEEMAEFGGDKADEAAEVIEEGVEKGLKKAGKEVVEEAGEGILKRAFKWLGRKGASTLPLAGAGASIILAPDDQSPEETVAHAIASEIGVGPVDADLLWDIGAFTMEGAQRRAKWEFEETLRLEKKGLSAAQIAIHVNRGAKW